MPSDATGRAFGRCAGPKRFPFSYYKPENNYKRLPLTANNKCSTNITPKLIQKDPSHILQTQHEGTYPDQSIKATSLPRPITLKSKNFSRTFLADASTTLECRKKMVSGWWDSVGPEKAIILVSPASAYIVPTNLYSDKRHAPENCITKPSSHVSTHDAPNKRTMPRRHRRRSKS